MAGPLDPVVAQLRAAGCVFAEDEARVLVAAAGSAAELDALVAARIGGLPLEHVVGWAEFCGLRVEVDPGVFVPRRRSELLVREAVAAAEGAQTIAGRARPVVLDLCCGSGVLGAAVAARLGAVELHAAELDPAAAACARRNVAAFGGAVYLGDLFGALPDFLRGRVDVLVANGPYVPSAEVALLPPEARLHEPLLSLDGGADGLDVLRRVIAGAPEWLTAGGSVLVETSAQQAASAVDAVAAAGLVARVATCADLGATVVLGRRGASAPTNK